MFHCKQNIMNEDYFLIQGNVLHVLNLFVQTTTNKNKASKHTSVNSYIRGGGHIMTH